MGTYIAISGHGAELTSAYRKLEAAYHELQATQTRLRSVYARSMHARPKNQDRLLRQELTRLSDRVEHATSAYRKALDEYIRASSPDDGKANPMLAPRPTPPASDTPLLAGLRP